ncbi:LuxR family transcriptional regulator [Paenibacillus albiflavus]|uniref:LuxR family transcriptional regulator n=1 Tax=Paenibacillus albiflavus TaxID=2545760 RepID=A0A4R4E149_9BACL|nr:LuxR C-terminal-related transcriptional regulator [Paenibacillus albiflavus]TCZ72152.1 LuxR family transcriptional regulator [Paenibacillus albiflavus]
MFTTILSTKLFIPVPRSKAVLRPRLVEFLNEGINRKLTLVSASTGYGKTTLVSEWLTTNPQPAAWLSLEEADNEPLRFLTYFVAALQTIEQDFGKNLISLLQSSQPPPIEIIITILINEITALSYPFLLVLDDYHVIDATAIDNALSILLERMPSQMHLVIITREEPRLPLARLRVRNQLTEVRAKDLRLSPSEVGEFCERVMGLKLTSENIALLASRTEGWVAGLQLAGLSMQGHQDPNSFIQSFSGNHQYIVDYLIDEVINKQSIHVQTFLLHTSILDRLCGSLCDAVMRGGDGENLSSTSGQEILEFLDRSNLFVIPLDNEKRWYRYHHLFAELLRNRLHQGVVTASDLYIRASIWFEEHDLEIEAFHYAAIAKDTKRAARLVEGKGMPLIFRGVVAPVLKWLDSLPSAELDAIPSMWIMYASALLMAGQLDGVEQKLQAAEKALNGIELNDQTKDLIGHIAAVRATLSVNSNQAETIITESLRALEYLHPDNLPIRTSTLWTMGFAYQLQGNRISAGKAYAEVLAISQKIGHVIITITSTLGLGNIQEKENMLYLAAESYREVITLATDPLPLVAYEAKMCLGRLYYEWNDLDNALLYARQSIHDAKQFEMIDRVIAGEVLLAKVMLGRGEMSGAATILEKVELLSLQHKLVHQIPRIAALQVDLFLHQNNLLAAEQLAKRHELRLKLAQVHLMQGNTSSALSILDPLRVHMEEKGLKDEHLQVLILQAVVLHAHGHKSKSKQFTIHALKAAESGGFIRIFVDLGIPMRNLLHEVADQVRMTDYLAKLLGAFDEMEQHRGVKSNQLLTNSANLLIEPLSERELEVLYLIAQGHSNNEISKKLFIALPTVKGHNRIIFEKLQVKRRTEAVARARELGLLKE